MLYLYLGASVSKTKERTMGACTVIGPGKQELDGIHKFLFLNATNKWGNYKQTPFILLLQSMKFTALIIQ